MDKKICASRADCINDRLTDVYKEAFSEMCDTAKELGIVKIQFTHHKDVFPDTPNLVFEKDTFESMFRIKSGFKLEELSEMCFNDSYNCITLIGVEGSYACMDEYWGDMFNVEKIGEIYRAFMTIVGNDDLKPIELK